MIWRLSPSGLIVAQVYQLGQQYDNLHHRQTTIKQYSSIASNFNKKRSPQHSDFVEPCLNSRRAFLKLQSQEFICHSRPALRMLYSKKAYANIPNQVLQELQSLWSEGHSLSQEQVVVQGNRLLGRFLEVSISHRVKKPNWRNVYLKHLGVLSNHKNKALGLYYFKIACQLSKEISTAHLSRLLQKQSNIQLKINTSQLKINYFKYLNDPKNFTFIEKISIKLCRYIASLSIKNDSVEDIFKHYLLAIISNLETSLKEKMRPIILAAFDSYCVYCIKHQASIQDIKLNIFNLIDNLMSLYSSNPSEHSTFYAFFSNFSTLLRTQPVRKFVCQFSQVCRVPEIIEKAINFIYFLYQGHLFTSMQLLQKLYLGILFARQSQLYFPGLHQTLLIASHNNHRLACIIKLLSFQNQLFRVKVNKCLGEFNQSIELFMITLEQLANYFSREELQKIVGIYLPDLNNLVSQNIVPLIQGVNSNKLLEISRSHMQALVEWYPACQSVLKIVQIINNQSKYQLIMVVHQEYLVYLSIFRYLMQPNELNLLSIVCDSHAAIFNRACSSSALFRVLVSINKLCLSELCRPSFQDFVRSINNFNFKYLIQNSKCYLLFSSFERLENPFFQKANRYQTIFSVNLLVAYVQAVLKAQRALSGQELQQNQDNFNSLLSAIIVAIGQHYQYLQEATVAEILGSIIQMKTRKKSQNILKIIKDVVSREVFVLIKQQNFLQVSQFRQFLLNYLHIYRNVLNQKQQVQLDEKLDFVDFCFNLKSRLCDLFHCFKKQKQGACIQQLIDTLQSLQLQVLQSNPVQFIHSLYIMLEQDEEPNLNLLASISIKLLYCLIYPNCFGFDKEEPKQFRVPSYSIQAAGVPVKECLFVQQELQSRSTLLKQIKTRCKKLHNIFDRLPFLSRFSRLSQQIVIFQKVMLQPSQFQCLRIHLGDLIHLAYLCGLNVFKNLLFSLYLTVTKTYYGVQIYLFEIARFIALQMFDTQTLQCLQRYLETELQHQKPYINDHFQGAINLLLKGQITPQIYESKRIFRILYYFKNDALPLVNDYKTIIWTLCSQVFTFFHNPFEDVQREKSLLRMSKQLILFNQGNKHTWAFQIWKQDWSCLRLLVLFFSKIFKKILQLNELSKIRSILPFVMATLIKSGHFDQLGLPIQIMMLKKKDVDFLQIADSLLKIVGDEIDTSEYKKIDRILCGKRKSLSMGLNLDCFGKIVDKTFSKAGRVGRVLADIFMMIMFQMLGTNQWQKYKCYKKMPIYKEKVYQITIFDKLWDNKELSIIEELNHVKDLSQALPQLLFQDYRLALVLKDYISQFLDQAIQHSDTLSVYQNIQLDKLIVKIAVTFQEYNFAIKHFWCNHTEHLSLSDQSFAKVRIIEQLLSDYKNIGLQYKNKVQSKIQRLQLVKYPLNIIFPIGNFVYNVACKDSLLVTYVRRVNFEDKIEVCEDIIQINSQVLSQGDMKISLNHKKRKGLDNQLGKTILSTDFGIADFDAKSISPSSMLNEILSIHPSLAKFLHEHQQDSQHLQHFVRRYKLGDVQSIRNKIRKVAQRIDQCLKLKQGRENILIYLYSKYLSFSFEGIQSINNYKAVYRIPSLEYLFEHQYKERVFNINLCKYLINTKNNLPQTEKKFQMIKKNFPYWVGIVGRVPPAEEIVTLLNRDLFLYMGHGTGLEHIPPSQYVKFRPTCAMLVYGCSSSLMTYDSSQPFGCTFDFLMNGCPAYLGCLWNVTDVDLDRITAQMFLQEGEDNLSSILKQSKLNCYFPHLNGASVVVYGLPSTVIRK